MHNKHAVTQTTVDRLQVFINKCLQSIVNIHWPDTVANRLTEGYRPATGSRKWNWFG